MNQDNHSILQAYEKARNETGFYYLNTKREPTVCARAAAIPPLLDFTDVFVIMTNLQTFLHYFAINCGDIACAVS